MRIKLILVLLAFAQWVSGQAKELYFESSDTIYMMIDHSFNKHVDSEKSFIWDYRKAHAACYEQLIMRPNEDHSVFQGYSKKGLIYKFGVSKDGLYLRNHRGVDPFFDGQFVNFEFKKGIKLFEKDMDIYRKWNTKDEFQYTIVVEPNTYPNYPNAEKLKIIGTITGQSRVEAFNSLRLPNDIKDVTLISSDFNLQLEKIHYYVDGEWIETSVLTEKLSDRFKIWRYISDKAPYFIAELNINTEDNSQNLKYFSDRRPSHIQNCELDGQSIYLYPNPGFGDVNLKFENQSIGDYQFVIYDVIGRKILERDLKIDQPSKVLSLNLKSLNKGSYLYAIIDPKGKRIFTKKLVILSI